MAQTVSLLVKLGALIFVLALSKKFSINLQLLGGVWILQTFPAIVVGLYTRWFHRWALVIGWAVAMVYGTITAYNTPAPGAPGRTSAPPRRTCRSSTTPCTSRSPRSSSTWWWRPC